MSQPDDPGGAADPATSIGASPSLPADQLLTEDLALSILKDRDLRVEQIETISKNTGAMKSRKVRIALAAHPQVPRRLALRLIRQCHTFDLMQFALMPAAGADLKRIADELLVSRLSSVTFGERLSLARRSSPIVAGALLLDNEPRVWQVALENPRLTESVIIRALERPGVRQPFVEAVCHHRKWSLRYEIRLALLRNRHTPLARALEFSRRIPSLQLRDVLHASRLPEKIKKYLKKESRATG